MVIPIVIGALGTVLKDLESGGLEEWKIGVRIQNYSLVGISKNTEKSPGNLRRLAVTYTPGKDYQLKLVWKTRQEYNNI